MRYISLLEFQPGLTANIMPPSSYLEKTNGTLVPEHSRVIIDENGFMVSDRPLLSGHQKGLLLGGSSIENLYIREDQRVLAALESQLAELGQLTKVYSAGISNAHLLHLVNILMNKGLGLRPDWVAWYPTSGTDVLANEVPNAFWNGGDAISTVRKAGKELKLDLSCTFTNRNGFADEARLLRALFDICRTFGIRLCVATWPVYGAYDDFMARLEPDREAFAQGEAQMQALNAVIREVCHEKQGALIDLEAAVVGLHRPDYFYDRNHPNAKGCELIAAATARVVAAGFTSPETR